MMVQLGEQLDNQEKAKMDDALYRYSSEANFGAKLLEPKPQIPPTTNKYLREIKTDCNGMVDVYAVLVAFNVTCPARAHAIKKLLCAGQRGKGNTLQDLHEASQAVFRAIELASGEQYDS